ncbi:MAG TPA: alpha/beta hydrolase [Kineosporiaceae bacterium]|nr:alpha/beta hydrolase [Kineosporiaceae bacterium]
MADDASVRYAHNGEVRIAYEMFGDPASGEPLLLIMGLDFQMLWWHDDFCRALVDSGFAVVRFDNRDAGLSTHFSSPQVERPWRAQLGMVPPAYTIPDMVADGLAVMDAVGWSSAHILGGSMGGLIAQATGLLHPQRVRSVTSALALPAGSSPLRTLSYLRLGGILKLARAIRRGTTDEEQIAELLDAYRIMASPGVGFDEEWARTIARRCHERAPQDPTATQRQMSTSRGVKLPPLAHLQPPLLVINGEQDPLVKVAAGRATARAVPGARFVSFPGMAHAFPRPLWPAVVAEIAGTAQRDRRALS